MLSESIKALRQAHNWTQVDLAKKLNVSKQSVSNWENDNIQPSIEQLVKIADVFSVSTDYLLGREHEIKLDVSGLSLKEIAHIQEVVIDLKRK